MMRRAALAGVLLLGGAYYFYSREAAAGEGGAGEDWLSSLSASLASLESQASAFVAGASGELQSVFQSGDFMAAGESVVIDGNVAAFLQMIRYAEGTSGPNGYRTLFGGGLFDSFADHPRQSITRRLGGRDVTSTAAGAYQFLSSTWDDARRALKLPDFSPASQDAAALWLIRRRDAYGDVRAGRFALAVQKCSAEWASLPGAPYGQPTKTLDDVAAVYSQSGGFIA